MTVAQVQPSTTAPSIPRPRAPRPDTTAATAPQERPDRDQPVVPEPPAAEFPWPEPWHHSRAARPRSEFWDVATASWHSRGPYPERAPES